MVFISIRVGKYLLPCKDDVITRSNDALITQSEALTVIQCHTITHPMDKTSSSCDKKTPFYYCTGQLLIPSSENKRVLLWRSSIGSSSPGAVSLALVVRALLWGLFTLHWGLLVLVMFEGSH